METPQKCNHLKLEKQYYEEPIEEPDYHGIWYVEATSRYVPVTAFEPSDSGVLKCSKCGEERPCSK